MLCVMVLKPGTGLNIRRKDRRMMTRQMQINLELIMNTIQQQGKDISAILTQVSENNLSSAFEAFETNTPPPSMKTACAGGAFLNGSRILSMLEETLRARCDKYTSGMNTYSEWLLILKTN